MKHQIDTIALETAVKALAHSLTLRDMLIEEDKKAEYNEKYIQNLKVIFKSYFENLGVEIPEQLTTF